jgi:hypothetical protein
MAAGYATAALAGYEIVSGFQQAELMRDNAKLTRQVNEMNAQYAEIDANNAELDGIEQENRYQTVIDQTIGNQRVAYAAQDVDINFGTALAVQAESKLTGMLNQMDIRNQAHNKAVGYKTQARQMRLQGYLDSVQSEVRASATQNAAIMGAAKTGLSGYAKKGE